jgi:hypothetical protein
MTFGGMTTVAARATLAGVAIGAVLTGCGPAPSPTQESSTSAEIASGTMPSKSATAPADPRTIIDVTIAGGTVTPTNAQAQAVAGRPIVLAVSSDVVDELHVHSVPEHTFDVDARPDQQFEFTVDVPGRVDVELHDLHRTVVTIEVLP